LRYTLDELIAEGDAVAVRWTAAGTHEGRAMEGAFAGMRPTGKRVSWSGVTVFHLRDGRIVDDRIQQDLLALLTQLGADPVEPPA
jgi:predicted ester cyclase